LGHLDLNLIPVTIEGEESITKLEKDVVIGGEGRNFNFFTIEIVSMEEVEGVGHGDRDLDYLESGLIWFHKVALSDLDKGS